MRKSAIVIPCYNEEKRINKKAFIEFLKVNSDFEVFFVNDGSTDNTVQVVSDMFAFCDGNAHIIDYSINKGKAEAIRCAMLELVSLGKYSNIGYLDADLATPLKEYKDLNAHLVESNFVMVMGIRLQRLGANIKRRNLRHYFGRFFSTFASIILKLPVYDTQCGAKVFRAEIIKELFDKPFISKWIFDVEIIARIRNKFGKPATLNLICELPLQQWSETKGSKITMLNLLRVPIDLIRIHFHYN